MRKSLIALTLLLAVTFTALGAASAVLYGRREQVVFTAVNQLGDPAAAEGLVVESTSSYAGHLFWTSTVAPGAQTRSGTEYRFVRKDREIPYVNNSPAVRLDYDTATSHYYRKLPAEVESGNGMTAFTPVVEELLAEAAPGGAASREVRLADYWEYYPVSLSLNFDWGSRWPLVPDSVDAVERGFRDFFRIPVLENQFATVDVDTQPNGNLLSWGLMGDHSLLYGDNDSAVIIIDGQPVPRKEGTDGFQMESWCAEFPDAVYLVFDAHSIRGGLVDTSHIPGGFGIYALPLDRAAMEGEDKYRGILADRLATVYPLDPEHHVLDLIADPAGEDLLLFTREDEVYVLTVIDRRAMTARQRIELPRLAEKEADWAARMEDGYLVAAYDGSGVAVFQPAEDGTWELALTSSTHAPDGRSCGYLRIHDSRYTDADRTFFAWDGKRLAAAGIRGYGEFDLTVFAPGNAAFYAVYENSLSPAALSHIGYTISTGRYDPLAIAWVN